MKHIPTNKTYTTFYLSAVGMGGHWSQDGWSGYATRWALNNNGKLPQDEQVYGYEQALAHAEEMRTRFYEGKQPDINTKFIVVIKTTVETKIVIE